MALQDEFDKNMKILAVDDFVGRCIALPRKTICRRVPRAEAIVSADKGLS